MAKSINQRTRSRLDLSQLPTRSTSSGDVEHFRRSRRPDLVHPGPSPLVTDEYKAANLHGNVMQISQPEPKSTPQRKRVPVACERCRKRKIKCSGDEGLGRGCMNCLNSGWDRCQFLRVCDYRPFVIDQLMEKVQSFNPPVSSMASTNNRYWGSNRYHPYSYSPQRDSHTPLLAQSSSSQQTSSFPMWQSGTEFSTCPSSSTQPFTWERLPFSTTYQLAYANNSFPPFSTPPPSYMLPDPVFQQQSGSGFLQGAHRSQQGSLWIDHTGTVPATQSLTAHVPTSYEFNNNDVRQSNLSYMSTISDLGRILPEPAGCRSLPFSTVVGTETPPPLSALSHQSTASWPTDSASSTSVISSHSSAHSNPTVGSPYTGLVSSSSQDFSFGYTERSKTAFHSLPSPNSSRNIARDNPSLSHRPSIDSLGSHGRHHSENLDEELQSPDNPADSYDYASVSLRDCRTITTHHQGALPASSTCWPHMNDKSSTDQAFHEDYRSRSSHDKINISDRRNSSSVSSSESC